MSLKTKMVLVTPTLYHPYAKSLATTLPHTDILKSSVMPALNVSSVVNDVDLSVHEVIEKHPVLDLPQVRCRDKGAVAKKINQIVSEGSSKLMVISDFDFTLSRFVDEDGERCWTTHGVFDNLAKEVDETLSAKFQALHDKYFPIEFCSQLSQEEKIPHMESWWGQSHGHIIKAGFKKDSIYKFVKESKIKLRDGVDKMMTTLDNSKAPLVIFSAGIGNIIEFFFEQRLGKLPVNTHVISNMMKFDQSGCVESFSEPLIHTFCKNSSVIRKDAEFFHEMNGRTNVILLGDSMGDIHMDVGVEKDGPTLKIGFLNSNIDRLLDHYMDVYDIVLIGDHTMDVANQIIHETVSRS